MRKVLSQLITENCPTIIIVDFNDSYTYNIASECTDYAERRGLPLEMMVLPWKKAVMDLRKICLDGINKNRKVAVILGPGPGEPDGYPEFQKIIKWFLVSDDIYLMGICLGFQLMVQGFGGKVKKSIMPMHGRSVNFRVPKWEGVFNRSDWKKVLKVQRYNSLSMDVKNLDVKMDKIYLENGEFFAGSCMNCLMYQFHPESIGTSCPSIFFSPLFNFLYNIKDDEECKNQD